MSTATVERIPSERERELHEHYSRNALARGHEKDCAKVTTFRNWPTILGRPGCTCKARKP